MIKKQRPQINKGSVSPLQLPSNLYVGHKTSSFYTVQGNGGFKRPKTGKGGCGCGSVSRPKRIDGNK